MFATCPKCRSVFRPGPVAICPACGTRLGIRQEDDAVSHDDFFATLGGNSEDSEPHHDPIAPDAASPVEPAADPQGMRREHSRFLDTLDRITPRVFVTRAIVVANLLIFVAMALSTGEVFAPSGQSLIDWQANYGPRTLGGEWWRLLTSTFIHVGLIHVALNMWVLWDLGRLVERLAGNVGFLLLYLLSGISGSLASVYWDPNRLSAGASGAVFGAFGALMGFLVLRSDSIPKHILSGLRNSGLTFLAYNLVFGLSLPFIDNAAHIGGLVAGFACGLLLSQPLDRVTVRSRAVRNLLMLVIGGGVLTAAIHWAPDPPPEPAARANLQDEAQRWLDSRNRSLHVFEDIARKHEGQVDNSQQIADDVEAQILPEVRAATERLDGLRTSGPKDQRTLDLLRQEADRLQRAWLQMVEAIRENDRAKLEEAQKQVSILDPRLFRTP